MHRNAAATMIIGRVIAEKLVFSPKTIRNQTSNIFSKLQVPLHSEAIIKAREADLGR